MDKGEVEQKLQVLSEENERMRAALQEIRHAIDPFLEQKKPSAVRTFEQQLVHDVRNILNELGLLRALVPNDEPMQ
jgi:DUF438 domain-containing protein